MAKKRKYRIVGISPPGLVDIYPYGPLRLFDLDDDRLEKILAETQCKFIQPEVDAPAPKQEIATKDKPSKSE